MGLISGVLTLPLAPVRGVIWLGQKLEDEARRQLSDPAAVRREIAAADAAYEAGTISADERDRIQDELVARLLANQPGGYP
jgi:hypothetical protein